jgi:hypothetical protein
MSPLHLSHNCAQHFPKETVDSTYSKIKCKKDSLHRLDWLGLVHYLEDAADDELAQNQGLPSYCIQHMIWNAYQLKLISNASLKKRLKSRS